MDWQSWGLLLSAYTSATLLPGSSELALGAVLLQAPQQWLWWLGVATVGNVLGSMTSWGMGYWLACYRPLRQLADPAQHTAEHATEHRRALGWLQRYGYWSLLLAWVPVVGDPLCLLAGWLRWSFWISLVLILLGKTVRYGLVVMAAGLWI
ncbi:YqaA family protein [Pseudaeromonas pectinilytica]